MIQKNTFNYLTCCLRDMTAPFENDARLRDAAYAHLNRFEYVMEYRSYLLMLPRQSGKTHFIKSALNSISDSWVVTMNHCWEREYKRDGYHNAVSVHNVMNPAYMRANMYHKQSFTDASCLFFDESVKYKDTLSEVLGAFFNCNAHYGKEIKKEFFVMGLYT